MIVQTEDRNYVRDTASLLLSNVNQSERDAYYNRRTVFRKQKQAINNLQNEVSEMKSELSEIKELLKVKYHDAKASMAAYSEGSIELCTFLNTEFQ